MPWLSDDRMWEVFGTRGLFQASYGAADFGECRLAVDRVGAGGADDWCREWAALADGLVETADADAAAGRPASARDGYLRATTYYLVEFVRFEVSSVAGNITCPTLLTFAEDDPIAGGAPKLYDAIASDRKELLRFTVAGGASGHCEANGRRQFHQRSYAWLSDVVPPDA
jgi:pimeloyl-ACP methyl ester carboxylesterase